MRHLRDLRAPALLTALALVILAVAVLPARPAEAQAAPARTTLRLSPPREGRVAGTYLLTARLTDAAGKALGNRRVRFYERVDFMGTTRVLLGAAVTDTSGEAEIAYRPIANGGHELMAEFAGDAGLEKSAAPAVTLEATGATYQYQQAVSALDPIARFLPWAALVVVLGVWATLALVAIRVVTQMPHAGRSA